LLPQERGRFGAPDAMLGVRPVNNAAIDIVVWWYDDNALVNTCPRLASTSICGVETADP
jgi:hypothetical protein